ncbi:MAG: DUF445 family protein [Balneolaceae bacterium]
MTSSDDFKVKDESPAPTATRIYFKRLWNLLLRYSGIEQLNETKEPKEDKLSKSPVQHPSRLLTLLRFIPWALALLFLFSFFFDFQDRSVSLFGSSYPLEGLLKVLSVSGLIGFLTNWLAITMLFRPLKKRPILGQGLIPAQKKRVAYRLAHAVSVDLINPNVIKQKIRESEAISHYRIQATAYLQKVLEDPNFRKDLKIVTVEYIHSMIEDPRIRSSIAQRILTELETAFEHRSIEKAAVKTYTFLRGRQLQNIIEDSLKRLPVTAENELEKIDLFLDELPYKLNHYSDSIENLVTTLLHRLINQLDVHALVEENLQRYDERKLEAMIKGASHEQLSYIQYLGAILGTIGGFIIWQPLLSLAVLGILFAMILSADQLLFYLSAKNII